MKAIGYVVSFGVFLLGLFLMGLAFEITAFQPETFFLGLLAMCGGSSSRSTSCRASTVADFSAHHSSAHTGLTKERRCYSPK